jgi:hypothetical protein
LQTAVWSRSGGLGFDHRRAQERCFLTDGEWVRFGDRFRSASVAVSVRKTFTATPTSQFSS